MDAGWLKSPFERRSIQHAMKVRDADGTVLGRVKGIGETVLFVRRRFSRKLWAVPLSHVERVNGHGVYVSGRGSQAVEPVRERWRTEIVTAIHPLAEASPPAEESPPAS